MSPANTTSIPDDRLVIRQFFDAIAFRYDFLNHFLSFKLDERWRKKSRDLILEGYETSILDLGIGTGKFLKLFLEKKSWQVAVGVDFSEEMLKRAALELPAQVKLLSADFHALPFSENSFDLVISAFTLRSVKDMDGFLKGVYKILTPKGKAGFLCLTRPQSVWWKILYYPYLKFYLPLMGKLFSGRSDAYQFLSNSILSFQEPEKTAKMMEECGFFDLQIHRLSFGMATLIVGKKK